MPLLNSFLPPCSCDSNCGGPLLGGDSQNKVFEACLSQNLDFKATFPKDKINPSAPAPNTGVATGGPAK